MNEREGKKLDQYFKDRLDPVILSEVDEDWETMKAMLQARNKRRNYTKLSLILGSVAALLFVIFSLFINKESGKFDPKTIAAGKKNGPLNARPGKILPDTLKHIQQNEEQNVVAAADAAPVNLNKVIKDLSFGTIVPDTKKAVLNVQQPIDPTVVAKDVKELNVSKDITLKVEPEQIAANTSQVAANKSEYVTDVAAVKKDDIIALSTPSAGADTTIIKKNNKVKPAFKPSFALAFSIAPDMSGVNSINNDKLGFGGGVSLSVSISRKFSLSTGVMYAQKIYDTQYANYKPDIVNTSYYQPDDVRANCSVLDIPLNVNYSLYQKDNNTLSVGTGLSSYIMLKEKYRFDYTNVYSKGVKGYDINNEYRHFFGVANLQVNYERMIAPGFSIGVSPYVKLPLTGIGYGHVNLQSAGVAFSVKTELKSFKKKSR